MNPYRLSFPATVKMDSRSRYRVGAALPAARTLDVAFSL